MASKSFRSIFASVGLPAIALIAIGGIAQSGPADSATRTKPKLTEEAFKNIQVLKGIPADQLIPAMQFITASLGVECDFCHQEGAFDKDDKKPKQTARKMMQMTLAINKDNFDGHREVTCYSCHRGAPRPLAIPIISDVEQKPITAEAAEAMETPSNAASLPDANKILDNYVRAVGGADAIQKISSRVQKGTINLGGHKFAVEIFTEAPAKRATVMHLPNGNSVTAYDGHDGWLATPGRPLHEMSEAELDAAKIDADLHFPMNARFIFSDLSVERKEKLGDRDVYVVSGLREGQPPVKLYFDERSGFLLRLVRYAESPLGRNPTQIDYSDYRDSGGLRIPFQWTIARPGGRFTIQVDQVQQNVPVDAAKFSKPVEARMPEQTPPPQLR